MELLDAIEQSRSDDPYLSWSYQSWASSERHYIYMSIPKVACTSIKSMLHRLAGGELPAFLGDVHDLGTSLTEFTTPDVIRMITSPEWFKFAFVRNPYTRLFSAYKSKICILGSLDSNSSWKQQYEWLRSAIREAYDYPARDGKRVGTISFRDFIDYLANGDDQRAINDIHINLQTRILQIDHIPYDFIGRFENISDDLTFVLRKLGALPGLLSEVSAVTNESPHIPHAAVYDRNLARLVHGMYEPDFAAFGYTQDSWMFEDD